MALSMEELRGKLAAGPPGAACVVGLAIGEVGGLVDEPSTGFGVTGWWPFPVSFGAMKGSGLLIRRVLEACQYIIVGARDVSFSFFLPSPLPPSFFCLPFDFPEM